MYKHFLRHHLESERESQDRMKNIKNFPNSNKIEVKGKINSLTVVAGDFEIPLSKIDRTTWAEKQ